MVLAVLLIMGKVSFLLIFEPFSESTIFHASFFILLYFFRQSVYYTRLEQYHARPVQRIAFLVDTSMWIYTSSTFEHSST